MSNFRSRLKDKWVVDRMIGILFIICFLIFVCTVLGVMLVFSIGSFSTVVMFQLNLIILITICIWCVFLYYALGKAWEDIQ